MKSCVIDKLGEIYKISLDGTVNYKTPKCANLENVILEVIGYGYYSAPKPMPKVQDYRYFLNIEIKNSELKNEKELVAILMNPSNTFPNKDKSKVFDSTIKNIIRIAYKLKYNRIIVFNSYPRIDGDSSSQKNKKNVDKDIAKKNTEFIENYIIKNKDNSTFLIAWGGNDNKVTNIQTYMKIFYDNNIKIYAYKKTSNNKPCHASILVENCYGYVSNFLNHDYGLQALSIERNLKKQYKFI